MKPTLFLIGSLGAVLSASAIAGTMGASMSPESWSGVASWSAGPAWTNAGHTQTFYFAPYVENTYVAKKKTRTLAAAEFFAGFQHRIHSM